MPILTLQKRMRELGRLRMGQKVPTKSGGTRPERLLTWRFTTASRELIDHVSEAYGGEVKSWSAPGEGDQWECITERNKIPVIIPHLGALSQWYEQWSGGGMVRHCDGVGEDRSGQECICAAEMSEAIANGKPTARTCVATTRLNVLLPDIPDVGTWRVESHGEIAAAEFAGLADLLSHANVTMLTASLRIDARTIKRINAQGKPETFHFVCPVIEDLPGVGTLLAPNAEAKTINNSAPNAIAESVRVPAPIAMTKSIIKTAPPERSRTRAAADRMRAAQDEATAQRNTLDNHPSNKEDISSPMRLLCADLHIPLNRGWLHLLRKHADEFGDLTDLPKFTALKGEKAKKAEDILRRELKET